MMSENIASPASSSESHPSIATASLRASAARARMRSITETPFVYSPFTHMRARGPHSYGAPP